MRIHQVQGRRGSILPLLVIGLVALLGFVALAVDVGMMALANTQCQVAADSTALTGVRTLNGDTSNANNLNNSVTATTNATTAATICTILSQPIQSSQVTIQLGSYTYNSTSKAFVATIPKAATDNYTLVQSTVQATCQTTPFGKLLGVSTYSVQTTATAVHRPRDIAVIMDFSGSMRFSSLLGLPFSGNRTASNNPDSAPPQFGTYSSVYTDNQHGANDGHGG